MSISERDKKVTWHPYTQMKQPGPTIPIIKGEREFLFDESGNKYIDAISSWWVNIHGHAHPYIAEKVSAQLKCLEHVLFAGFTHEPAVTLAERLLNILPGNQSRIFYSDNGSTSVEVAMKMAVQYWYNKGESRDTLIAFRNAYHGDTFGAMSAGSRSEFNKPFHSMLFDVEFIDVPTPENILQVKQHLYDLIMSKKVAAFIFEPLVQGTSGMIMYDAGLLDELLEVCRHNSVIAIADEVMTGFGRTGKLFASDYLKNNPDVICLSKGITGGTMALGVTSCTGKIYDAFLSDDKRKTFFHGHSYTANPIACSAAIASMDLLEDSECKENIARISKSYDSFMACLTGRNKIADVRKKGTILAIELAAQDSGGYFDARRDGLYRYFLDKRLLIRPLGNVIYIMPPYCISEESLQQIYDSIIELLKTDLI